MGGLAVEKYFGDIWAVFEESFKIIGLGVFDVGIHTAGADAALHCIPQSNAVSPQIIHAFRIADVVIKREKFSHYPPETIVLICIILLAAQ